MTNRLLSFARLAFEVAQRSVPDRRHRFAPKRYSQPRLLACVLLKECLGLVGQTRPLSDFATKRQLLRYAGMNLRERESGTYRGQTRLSKKGRPMLCKVLG